MLWAEKSGRILNPVLLSLLFFNPVFSAPIDRALRHEDVIDEGISGEDEDLKRLDIIVYTGNLDDLIFNTIEPDIIKDWTNAPDDWPFPSPELKDWTLPPPKPWVPDDLTLPSPKPFDIQNANSSGEIYMYIFIPFGIVFLIVFVWTCARLIKNDQCCTLDPYSRSLVTADVFIAVHSPPPRTTDLVPQVHNSGRNQFPDSRPPLVDFCNELDSTVGNTVPSCSEDRKATSYPVESRPPPYEMNYPTNPAFPNPNGFEPPPVYTREDPYLK